MVSDVNLHPYNSDVRGVNAALSKCGMIASQSTPAPLTVHLRSTMLAYLMFLPVPLIR